MALKPGILVKLLAIAGCLGAVGCATTPTIETAACDALAESEETSPAGKFTEHLLACSGDLAIAASRFRPRFSDPFPETRQELDRYGRRLREKAGQISARMPEDDTPEWDAFTAAELRSRVSGIKEEVTAIGKDLKAKGRRILNRKKVQKGIGTVAKSTCSIASGGLNTVPKLGMLVDGVCEVGEELLEIIEL